MPSFHSSNTEAATLYSNDIPPESEIIYDVEINSLSLQTIIISPDSSIKEFHVEILNQSQDTTLSRYNFCGFFNLIFASNNSYSVRISNPLMENLYIDAILSSIPLEERKGDGYNFESSKNWCWMPSIGSDQMKIISLRDLKAGHYLAEVSVLDDTGYVGLYITDLNPSTNSRWYESTLSFISRTFVSREILISKHDDWLVVFSRDDKPHDIVISFTHLGREFNNFEIVIIVLFFSPWVILLFLRVRRMKKKITKDSDSNFDRNNSDST